MRRRGIPFDACPDYTWKAMDKVRLGRAIGYGTRHAAKAVLQAVDAASAPGPAASAPSQATRGPNPVSSSAARPATTVPVVERLAQAQRTVGVSTQQARTLGRSVWSPVARFSGVLWLQVTGTIYTLIALILGQAVWMRRAALHLPPSVHAAQQAYLLSAAFTLFAYFAVSSFVRAARR
jgi:hypothetical protein